MDTDTHQRAQVRLALASLASGEPGSRHLFVAANPERAAAICDLVHEHLDGHGPVLESVMVTGSRTAFNLAGSRVLVIETADFDRLRGQEPDIVTFDDDVVEIGGMTPAAWERLMVRR